MKYQGMKLFNKIPLPSHHSINILWWNLGGWNVALLLVTYYFWNTYLFQDISKGRAIPATTSDEIYNHMMRHFPFLKTSFIRDELWCGTFPSSKPPSSGKSYDAALSRPQNLLHQGRAMMRPSFFLKTPFIMDDLWVWCGTFPSKPPSLGTGYDAAHSLQNPLYQGWAMMRHFPFIRDFPLFLCFILESCEINHTLIYQGLRFISTFYLAFCTHSSIFILLLTVTNI